MAMKILFLHYDDNGVPADLAKRLIQHGYDVTLGVVVKTHDYPFVMELPRRRFSGEKMLFMRKAIKHAVNAVRRGLGIAFQTTNGIHHSTNYTSIIDVDWINRSDYDIVHMHWVCNDMISIKDIGRIDKPLVWTMHDSWPCCGAEHHPNILEDDRRYTQVYTRKNRPGTTRHGDVCRKVWRLKKKYLSERPIVFVSPSHWEHDILKVSSLFHDHECRVIPNIVPHDAFRPLDRATVRDILGIPKDKTVLGFGAYGGMDNPKSMKGTYQLVEALKLLAEKDSYHLVLFGPDRSGFTSCLPIPHTAFGYISNSQKHLLAAIYNCCDIFLHPSLIENLPTTSIEAACCGVPTVAFNVGGFPDVVEHRKTGYLARPYDVNDFKDGIEYCMEHLPELSKAANCKMYRDFDEDGIAMEHIELYESMMRGVRN